MILVIARIRKKTFAVLGSRVGKFFTGIESTFMVLQREIRILVRKR